METGNYFHNQTKKERNSPLNKGTIRFSHKGWTGYLKTQVVFLGQCTELRRIRHVIGPFLLDKQNIFGNLEVKMTDHSPKSNDKLNSTFISAN